MRRIMTVLLALLCILSFPITAAAADGDRRVFDNAKLFDAGETEALEEKLSSFREKWQMDLGILTTEDAGGKTTKNLADDFYDEQGLGMGNGFDGALFVIDMDNREIDISTLGEMGKYLTDERVESVLDEAIKYISKGDYLRCADAAVDGIAGYMAAGIPAGQHDYIRNAKPSLQWQEVLAALVIAAAAAVMPCIGVINQYEMKKERRQSLNYHLSYRGSSEFQYALVNDLFLNKMVTQRRIPQNTGGSGGRGPGSPAGRTTLHRSSSGRMHGGGGRKF